MSATEREIAEREIAELCRLAQEARGRAYAPYSRFLVGAAVRTEDGRVFTGANVENASYGLTLCAERTAIAQAVLAGARRLRQVAVASANSPPAAPCGMCRQTIAEFAGSKEDMQRCLVVLVNERGEQARTTLAELLPMSFGPQDLGVETTGDHE